MSHKTFLLPQVQLFRLLQIVVISCSSSTKKLRRIFAGGKWLTFSKQRKESVGCNERERKENDFENYNIAMSGRYAYVEDLRLCL